MTPGQSPDHAFIEFVHGRRAVVGGVLLALATACLICAGWCGFRGLAVDDTPADVAAKSTETVVELDRPPYLVGLSAGLLAALGLGGVGAFFVGKVPELDADRRRRADRILLLVGGYVFGLALRGCGLFLFLWWFGKLVDWVGGTAGSHKTGWWPLAALLEFLVGAGVSFLAALPARSEERNQPWVRRAVYAVNFALSAVLLVVGLVLVNAVVATKLPDKLDTTSSGFYTLTPETRKYVAGLKVPVKAHLLTTELKGPYGRIQEDTIRLLNTMRQANPTMFEVEELSATANASKIRDLQDKYKAADLRELGVLLTSGKEGDRFEFVPLEKLASARRASRADPSEQSRLMFVGEGQLVGGMMALTEEKTVVYYTAASGELALTPSADPAAATLVRPAFRLQDALAAAQCEARPLEIDPFKSDAKVPDDAAMVLVLDPLTPLPPATAAALQRYMTTPRPGGQKGKLLVFAGAHNAPGSPTVTKTGLEATLSDLGVELVDRAIYTQPPDERTPADVALVGPDREAVARRNPIALAAEDGFYVRKARPLRIPAAPGRGLSTRPFMGVAGQRAIWLEKGVIEPPNKAFRDLVAAVEREDAGYYTERQLNQQANRTVGALTTDAEGKPVAAVFGFADRLSDDGSREDGGTTAGVFKASMGWLRERPPAPDIAPKEYDQYSPKKGVSEHTLLTLPLVGTLLAIVLLGLGVWAVRRK